jgi:ribosome recycling factor
MAEDTRVQLRKIQQASVKKGDYKKHSVELEEVCHDRFFIRRSPHLTFPFLYQFQKLTDRNVAEIDKILAHMKKSTGAR